MLVKECGVVERYLAIPTLRNKYLLRIWTKRKDSPISTHFSLASSATDRSGEKQTKRKYQYRNEDKANRVAALMDWFIFYGLSTLCQKMFEL